MRRIISARHCPRDTHRLPRCLRWSAAILCTLAGQHAAAQPTCFSWDGRFSHPFGSLNLMTGDRDGPGPMLMQAFSINRNNIMYWTGSRMSFLVDIRPLGLLAVHPSELKPSGIPTAAVHSHRDSSCQGMSRTRTATTDA